MISPYHDAMLLPFGSINTRFDTQENPRVTYMCRIAKAATACMQYTRDGVLVLACPLFNGDIDGVAIQGQSCFLHGDGSMIAPVQWTTIGRTERT